MRRKVVELFLVLVILISTGAARAQTPNFGDILGGFIPLAQIQAARDAWDRLPARLNGAVADDLHRRNAQLASQISAIPAPRRAKASEEL